MPLSPDIRRYDKGETIATRIPKLELTEAMKEELKKMGLNIEIKRKKNGKEYVVLWDLPSCSFILNEQEKTTR